MISNGCVIHPKAKIKNCVLANNVVVHDGAELDGCVIMDSCEIKQGAKLKRVIIDRFNTILPRQTIGLDQQADAQRYYIDPSGIVVIPRGKRKFL